jgi:L-ascorbate metabolism protein UlaG (beta-lactamase superfamily)
VITLRISRMKTTMRIVALVFVFAVSAYGQAKQTAPLTPAELSKPVPAKGITVRYIANEGVLIAAGGKQVLIDGLHREYKPAYLFPPPEMQAVLENARAPYANINILLVSHMHLDHFHPQSIGLYLKGNSKSFFASSGQVVDEVAKNFVDYEKVKSQIRPITHEWTKSSTIDQDGIKVRFLGLRHSGEQFKHIQNLGHVIEIGGKKFIHIGDADMTLENFAAFNLPAEKIDVAFIPYWFMLSADGRKFVRDQFNAKQVIAVHIPPAEAEEVIQQLKRDMPDATAFTKILEERYF